MSRTISAIFIANLWRNEKNGTSCFRAQTKQPLKEGLYQTKDTDRGVTIYTILCDSSSRGFPPMYNGMPVMLRGDFIMGNYGMAFSIEDIYEYCDDADAMIAYLTTPLFPEIDISTAKKIMAHFGACLYTKASHYIDFATELSQVTEIPIEDCKAITKRLLEFKTAKEISEILTHFSVPITNAVQAAKKYGCNAKRLIMSNPYKTGMGIGLKFSVCDKLAATLHYTPYNASRIKMAAEEVMVQNEINGNTYMPLKAFEKQLLRVLTGSYPNTSPQITNIIGTLGDDYGIAKVNSASCIYKTRLNNAERRIADNIRRLVSCSHLEAYSPELLDYAQNLCGIKYGEQQKKAFASVLALGGIAIINGGPGTGKTTLIKGLIYAYLKMHPTHRIKLCAPTGRAAQRLSEGTGMPASTIHRLLEWQPCGDTITHRDRDNPIEADLIIVDEISMCDVVIFDILLSALQNGTTIILAGDIDQLESVGPGAVLKDLITCDERLIKVIYLTEIFRQKDGSAIIDNSNKIRDGITSLSSSDEFVVLNTESDVETLEMVKKLFTSLYDSKNPFATQVLCTSKKGLAGTSNLNNELHSIYKESKCPIYGNAKYIIGDKIIMNSNNVSLNYYNGDLGIVTNVANKGMLEVNIRGQKITLFSEMMDDVDLAYACTIHKSQGSEFDTVIVVIPEEPALLLYRNLLYTAVTRAKKRVFVVNEAKAMESAILKEHSNKRLTLLSSYLPIGA